MHFRYLSIKCAGRENSSGCLRVHEDTLQIQAATTCYTPTCTEVVFLASQFGFVTTSNFFLSTPKSQVHILYKVSCLRNISAFSLFYILLCLTFCPLYLLKISLNITTRISRIIFPPGAWRLVPISHYFRCRSQEGIV